MGASFVRTLFTVVAVIALGSTAAVAEDEEFELVPADEQVMLGIGCEGDTVCDSVEYWLGRDAGGSSVGNVGTFTPLTWVDYHVFGTEVAYADFFHGDTLASTYILRTDEPVQGQISMGGFIGGGEVAADSTVRLVLTAQEVGGGFVNIGEAEVNKIVKIPGDTVYEFEFELDEALEEVEVRNLQLTLYVRSVAVLQNGFVNGQGDSWFNLPYYHVVPVIQAG
jgi:hypothetical protein